MTTLDRLLARRFGNLTLGRGKPLALAALCALGLPACDGGGDGTGSTGQIQTSLRAFDDCDALLGYFQAEALAEVQHWGWMGGGRGFDDALGAPSAEGGGNQAPGGDLGGAGGGEEGVDFSGTNVQEAGVDEPDQVKTDGEFLYLVRGSRLLIYAAADLSLQSETALGLYGAQLLLDGDRLAVIGTRWGALPGAQPADVPERFARTNKAQIAVYDVSDRAAPQQQRLTVVEGEIITARLVEGTARVVVHFDAAQYVDFSDLPGMSGGGTTVGGQPPRAEPGDVGQPEPTEPEPIEADPAPAPEGSFEARRDAQEVDFEAAMRALIEDTELSDWIPYRVDYAEGEAVAAPIAACRQFHRPGEPAGHGVTAVISVDLDDPAAGFADPAVVTAPGVVYASRESLYLTTVNHSGWLWGGSDVAIAVEGGAGTVTPSEAGGSDTGGASSGASATPDPVPDGMGQRMDGQAAEPMPQRQATQIHKLAIGQAQAPAAYRGSGRVFGTPLNQFSLGEHADHLRIATTENQIEDFEPTNHLFVMGEADGGLAVTGQVTDIARTERIYAVRLMGDRGFMVTFRQTDPLFTFDLSDPTAPQQVGELHVPGFSTYLHPLGDAHLIGIGQSATDEGQITGMQLSLFDVSDFANPTLAHTQSLGQGWSGALYDHHAFLYWAPRNLVAVPIEDYGEGGWGGGPDRDPPEVRPEPHVGLEMYTVSTADGFADAGFVHHMGLSEDRWAPGIERSLIIGDHLFAVSGVGVTAHGLDDGLAADAQAVFPADPGLPGDGEGRVDGPGDPGEPALPPDEGGAPDADPDQGT